MTESGADAGPWSGKAGWVQAHTAAERLGDLLRERALTIGVAESLTGGATSALLTLAPGASDMFRGAVVAYATDLKSALLDVNAEELERTGPVTGQVAAAMAQGARRRLGADVGIATTGEAGPSSSSGTPVGTVFVAVANGKRSWVRQLDLDGGRDEICAASCANVLSYAAEVLEQDGSGG